MTARVLLVLGDDGVPQQLQAGDTAAIPGLMSADGVPLGLRSAGQVVVTSSVTLDRASCAGRHILAASSGITLTLPDNSGGYRNGECIAIKSILGLMTTINLAFPGGGDGRTSLAGGASCFFFSDGNGYWRAFGYSAG